MIISVTLCLGRAAGMLAASALVIGALVAPALAAPVRVGMESDAYAPFSSKNAQGQLVGFEVDLTNAICKAAKIECQLVDLPFDGLIAALTSSKIDAIFSSMSITDERKKTIDFSLPYYNTPPVFVSDKGTDLKYTSEGLKGKIIGVQSGTIHLDYANKYFGKTSTVKVYQSQDDANADLAAGRIDTTLADAAVEDSFLASEAGKCCERKADADKADPIFGTGIGAGIRKGDTELAAKINDGIRAVYKSGEFEKLEKPVFGYDIGTPPQN